MLEFIKLTKEQASDIIERQETGDIIALERLKEYAQNEYDHMMSTNPNWNKLGPTWCFTYFAEFLIYMNNIVTAMEIDDIETDYEFIESYRTNMRLLLERCEKIIEEA